MYLKELKAFAFKLFFSYVVFMNQHLLSKLWDFAQYLLMQNLLFYKGGPPFYLLKYSLFFHRQMV